MLNPSVATLALNNLTKQVLLSIIIPTHNRAELLPRAIESVLAQSLPDWELIVVDDGSTDHTPAIISSYDHDARIHYYYQDNRQLNGARNTGVAKATGSYIGFLDDDDEFLTNHLELLASAINADGAGHDIYRSGEILRRGAQDNKAYNYVNTEDILPQYWHHSTGLFGMLIRKEVLKANPFDEQHLLLDDFLWLNRVLPEASLHQVPAHTAVVNQHADQRSVHYLNDELLEQNVHRLAQAYNMPGVPARVPFEAYQQQIFHQYLHYSRQLGRKGKMLKALKYWHKGSTYATTKNAKELARALFISLTGK